MISPLRFARLFLFVCVLLCYSRNTCFIARNHYSQIASHEGAPNRCELVLSWAIMGRHGLFLTTDYNIWFPDCCLIRFVLGFARLCCMCCVALLVARENCQDVFLLSSRNPQTLEKAVPKKTTRTCSCPHLGHLYHSSLIPLGMPEWHGCRCQIFTVQRMRHPGTFS